LILQIRVHRSPGLKGPTFRKQHPLLKINLGQPKIIQSHKYLTHRINLQDFIDGVINFERAINQLKKNSDSNDAIESLSAKLQQLKVRVEMLLPKKRQRRGLINGLGSVVKIVKGNLDDADGRRINDNLKTITENQK